ncbi:hypothetical protein GCM10027590_16030 [Nocardiopsis nanhaiensis]
MFGGMTWSADAGADQPSTTAMEAAAAAASVRVRARGKGGTFSPLERVEESGRDYCVVINPFTPAPEEEFPVKPGIPR